jgi:hypothetical protein
MAGRPTPDMTGAIFGRLEVIAFAGLKPRTDGTARQAHWTCRCRCGTTVVKSAIGLRRGETKSCGCLHREMIATPLRPRKFAETTINVEYQRHRNGGTSRGFGFLPRATWERLVFQPCHYCGGKDLRTTNYAKKLERREDAVEMVGVDRVDSSVGYVEGNCVACCKRCNIAKASMPADEFLAWVTRVFMHSLSRESVSNGHRREPSPQLEN